MINVLLLEPDYKNKYPPLGLMKISYYHKEIRHDNVLFAKGTVKRGNQPKKWDRVYVTTLFTFEWEETRKTIEYAISVAKSQKSVYVGGILASLMPEMVRNEFPKIKLITGQLNENGKIGYDDDGCIDFLTPDYSMLEDIVEHYKYPTENAYIMYMTRGCGMKCGFCAVQKLEPNYVQYISIKEQIKTISDKYGVKRDLLLMDNNVLKSKNFNQIVDEIKEMGFAKGATYINPVTKKKNQRIVDFNQGLDAFLLTEEKAKKLAELAISPARIAFDHIEDEAIYRRAVSYCAKYGIRELSNYILYNSESFGGKGNKYNADTPEDLYNRMKLSIDLKDKLNEGLPNDQKIALFSFPMRYIPLQDTKRGYIGSNWNHKYLRAVQTIMIPTQGKGVSSRSFFNAAFGETVEEFMEVLLMPEEMIARRGHFVERKEESLVERGKRYLDWENDVLLRNEWRRLFNQLGPKKETFIEIICNSDLNIDKNSEIFLKQSDATIVKLLLHYLNPNKLFKLFKYIDDRLLEVVFSYCLVEFPLFLDKIAMYIYSTSNSNYAIVSNFLRVFGKTGVQKVFRVWVNDEFSKVGFLDFMYKLQVYSKLCLFNYTLLNTFLYFVDLGALNTNQIISAKKYIVECDDEKLKMILSENKESFIDAIKNKNSDEVGSDILREQIDLLTSSLFTELGIA